MDSIQVVAETKVRKVYIKPQVGTVSLVPKQTVLGTCFSRSDDRARNNLANPCTLAAACLEAG